MTPVQIKQGFRAGGQSIGGWARRNGYPPNKVILVLNGFEKGDYGKAHDIAAKFGMKPE